MRTIIVQIARLAHLFGAKVLVEEQRFRIHSRAGTRIEFRFADQTREACAEALFLDEGGSTKFGHPWPKNRYTSRL